MRKGYFFEEFIHHYKNIVFSRNICFVCETKEGCHQEVAEFIFPINCGLQ